MITSATINLVEQRRRARLHVAAAPRAGECVQCRKRPEYCRCIQKQRRQQGMKLVVDKAYARRILDKVAFACFVGLLAGCASKPVATTQPIAKSAIGQRIEEISTIRAEAQSLLVSPPATGTNSPGIPRTNVTWVIECPSWPVQVFDVISSPTPLGPWTHYTNVVQQDRFTVPTKLAANFFTIGRTWLVGNTNDVLRWEGW